MNKEITQGAFRIPPPVYCFFLKFIRRLPYFLDAFLEREERGSVTKGNVVVVDEKLTKAYKPGQRDIPLRAPLDIRRHLVFISEVKDHR